MNIYQAASVVQATVGESMSGVSMLAVPTPSSTGYTATTAHSDELSKCETSCVDLEVLGECGNADSVYYEPSPSVPHQQQQYYPNAYYQQDYVFNYYEQESSRAYNSSSKYYANGTTDEATRPPCTSEEFNFVASDSEYLDVHLSSHSTAAEDLPLFYQQSEPGPPYENSLYLEAPATIVERPPLCETSFVSQIGATTTTPVSDPFPEPVPPCAGSAGGVCRNSCTVCGRFYARSSTLKTHLRVHSGERPYACLQCLKRFSQAANLTAHMRIHSGEKPFLCPVCHRKFSQSSSVTTHMRTHSGERPYACSLCKKSFSDSSTLTKHFRTHSGERPYQCRVCFMRFSQSGNLNRHMKIHKQKNI